MSEMREALEAAPDDLGGAVVAEAIGPALGPYAAGGAVAMGSIGLLTLGVMPVLFGALAEAGRLSVAGIGRCAMLEALSMGISAGLCGALIARPAKLREVALFVLLALAGFDLLSLTASGWQVLAVRGLAGLSEGVLLWITVGMIARSETPDRWAGVFFTAMVSGQLALALAYVFVIPHFGANGGFVVLALAALLGIPATFYAPHGYAPLVQDENLSGAPPLRGWIALLATLVFTAPAGAVGVYLLPIALQQGLSADLARNALWVSLVGQVMGGSIATVLGGRVHWFGVFCFATALLIGAWLVMISGPSALVFALANGLAGLVAVMIGPFLVPMLIEADPTRRTAMQSGAAQILAAALGPLLASFVVSNADVYGAVWLGAGLVTSGLALMAVMHFIAVNERRRAQ